MTREEAIKIIRDTYHTDEEIKALESLIPELRESEDEMIRKELLDFVKSFWADHKEKLPQASRWVTYLEKQKEQEPISAEEVLARAGLKPYKDGNKWCILAGDNIQEGICGFGDTIDEALYEFLIEVLEMQKEQKPAEWNDTDMKEARDNLISVCRDWEHGKKTTLLPIAAVRARYFLEHLTEPKPAEWSEEDKDKDKVAQYLHDRDGGMPWSKATEITRDILDILRPSWKPSEEQMRCLCEVVDEAIRKHNESVSGYKPARVLESLYKQLQKL